MAQASSHLLQIISDTGGQLVVEQAPQSGSFGYVLAGLLLIAAIFFLWTRRWLVAGILLALMCVFLLIARPGLTHRLTVDTSAGTIAWQGLRNGKPQESDQVSVSDLASADLQFSQPGGRLILIRKNGNVSYPLGSTPLPNEPVQFIVVNRLKALLGQPQTSAPASVR